MSTHPTGGAGTPPQVRVGDYLLLHRIGEGGMGVVHLAQRSDGHRVALKVLRPHIVGDDEARERLAREVKSLSRVKSKWVAEIVDADPWGDVPFVATRYVPGLSLHDHIKEDGPIAGADLGWFAGGLAEALRAVHAVDVLHRDIKPSNVLMEGRAPVLIDFGLARVADDTRITHTGWLLGTPGYLAPEILYGEDATAASDVHSWAATVAYAGTGRSPFGRGPSMAVMDRVRRGEHDISGLPHEVHAIVHGALDPEPLNRPTLSEILAELQPGATRVKPAPVEEPPMTQPMSQMYARPETRVDPAPRQETVVEPDAPGTLAFEKPTHVQPHQPPTSYSPPYAPPPQPTQTQPPPQREPYRTPPPADPALAAFAAAQREPRAPFPERARRFVLLIGLLAFVAVVVAASPYLGTLLIAALVWTLRSGSLAATGARERQQRRGGRKWYDAVVTPFSVPWFFLTSLVGTSMLIFWAVGLVAAAGLLAFAFGAPLVPGLLGLGVVYGASLWWGPGGFRLRSPIRRVVNGVSRGPWPWLAASLLVVAVVVALGFEVSSGVDWSPANGAPWSDGSFFRNLV